MKLSEYPDYCKHALCVYESFRRLGFQPEEIFFEFATEVQTGRLAFFSTLHDQNDQIMFAYTICHIPEGKEEEMGTTFQKAIKLWNDTTAHKSRAALYDEHSYFDRVMFIASIQAKGLLEGRVRIDATAN